MVVTLTGAVSMLVAKRVAVTTTGAAVLLPRYDAIGELIEAFINGEPGA